MSSSKVNGYLSFKEITKDSSKHATTEIELMGSVGNMHGFIQLLKHHYFEVLAENNVIENL